MDASALLLSYMDLHNEGVRTGDFAPMLGLFHPRAEFRFEGIPFGPMIGREAIAEAFRHDPPDDDLYLGALATEHLAASARYAWRSDPGKWAGTIRLEAGDGLITRITVFSGRV